MLPVPLSCLNWIILFHFFDLVVGCILKLNISVCLSSSEKIFSFCSLSSIRNLHKIVNFLHRKEKGLFIRLENMPTTKFFFKCIRKILTWFYITCYTLICTLLFQSSWMHGENNKEKELLMIFFVSQTILSFLFQDFFVNRMSMHLFFVCIGSYFHYF